MVDISFLDLYTHFFILHQRYFSWGSMTTSNFPLLSFQEFLTGSKTERKAVAQKLYNAFHTYGWVYLKDFGITKEEIAEVFVMVSSQDTPI